MAFLLLLLPSLIGTFASASSLQPWQKAIFERHNALRVEVSAPPLSWDAALEANARKFVEGNTWCDTTDFSPLDQRTGVAGFHVVGENIAMGLELSTVCGNAEGPACPEKTSPVASVVDTWWGEHVQFDFETQECNEGAECGHFLQMANAQSLALGCAAVKLDCGYKNFVVCQYGPAYVLPAVTPFVRPTAPSAKLDALVGSAQAQAQLPEFRPLPTAVGGQQQAPPPTVESEMSVVAAPSPWILFVTGIACGMAIAVFFLAIAVYRQKQQMSAINLKLSPESVI
eukprot:TRINITY_DN1546_c0_g1_i3.p1 TRINITY_DN1546_c0_g1~~TRINITY_DN1546_c0_g1_i3.p1  ORF type:complete len:285 (+),score=43.27 TRINITY_DN1546_c0_g1_i3:393-1247(+)